MSLAGHAKNGRRLDAWTLVMGKEEAIDGRGPAFMGIAGAGPRNVNSLKSGTKKKIASQNEKKKSNAGRGITEGSPHHLKAGETNVKNGAMGEIVLERNCRGLEHPADLDEVFGVRKEALFYDGSLERHGKLPRVDNSGAG